MLKNLIFFILFPFVIFSAGPLDDLYNFFPKSSQLQGGNKKWLYTSIMEKRYDDYVVLSNTYTYYNEQNEKILGINRNTNFAVDISIYFAKNPTVAKSLYNKKIQESKLPVRREVDFGEESTVLINPISLKALKAEYNIFILNKNFLISIKTYDGFALMEFADYFDKIVKNYMLANIDRFFLDRFKIKLSYNDYKLSEEIVSTNTDVGTIIIKGKVIDSKGNPVFNAKLSLLGYGYETITDEKGEYRFEIKTAAKNKKYTEFTKNFILPSQKVKQEKLPLVAKIEIKQAHKTENAIVKIDFEELTGDLISGDRINKLTNIKHNNNTLSFVRDCSPKGSTFKCNQKIEFVVKDNNITGTIIGFGGKGTITGEVYSKIKEKAFFVGNNLILEKIIADSKLNIKNIEKNNLVITNSNEIKELVHFKLNKYNPSPLDISYELMLTKLPGLMKQSAAPIYLFEGEIRDNKLILTKKEEIIIKNSEKPEEYSFKIESPKKDYFIGFLPEYSFKETILFSLETAIEAIAPKFIVKSFENDLPEQKINFTVHKSENDFASTTKEIKSDGKPDTLIRLKGIKGEITDIEVSLSGKFKYHWSTVPNKILPVPAVLLNGKIANSKNGLFNLKLSEDDELLLYLGYPSWVNFDNSLMDIVLTLNGKKVELSRKITKLE